MPCRSSAAGGSVTAGWVTASAVKQLRTLVKGSLASGKPAPGAYSAQAAPAAELWLEVLHSCTLCCLPSILHSWP